MKCQCIKRNLSQNDTLNVVLFHQKTRCVRCAFDETKFNWEFRAICADIAYLFLRQSEKHSTKFKTRIIQPASKFSVVVLCFKCSPLPWQFYLLIQSRDRMRFGFVWVSFVLLLPIVIIIIMCSAYL